MSAPKFAIIDDDIKRASDLMENLQLEMATFSAVEASIQQFNPTDTFYFDDVCRCESACFIAMRVGGTDAMAIMRKLGERGYLGAVILLSEFDIRVTELASDLARSYNVHHLGTLSDCADRQEIHHLLEELKKYHTHLHITDSQVSEQALLDAISFHQIEPYYQPKLNAQTHRVTSIEVLARIVTPDSKFPIMPGQFIMAAEQHGLINLVTFQLVEKAVKAFPQILREFGEQCQLAINISPIQLEDLNFPNQLLAILEINHLKPQQFILEITEEYQIRTSNQLETLNRLRMLQFGTSLDDFGAGYTNIRQLRRLPFTEVKIDRSLISYIDNDRFSQLIVSTLNDLAKELNMGLVAEGIERPQEFQYLRQTHPEIALQGFLICKPQTIEGVIAWYQHWAFNHKRIQLYNE
ncbi:EAL domain-containing response regulator [Thaumasiovibrio subtropicus]|uniref:EAL domain-containing response regulator n=1 Tax=Thaumasiovibrio subtropicus TaxID=1891207 RepID=UPI000B35AFC4|nr:EAL domain-containing response regulator [Thaumasiovibrio subtropicus]